MIWDLCEGHRHIKQLNAEPWRVVEAQHILSCRDVVDTTEEHEILEEMLENSKPLIEKNKDYLIFTPFRYPPLKYGSRFGSIHEPSLWYGSYELETAFAETAYYRLMFLNDSNAELGYIELTLTAFQTMIMAKDGIDLTKKPFDDHREKISAKDNYEYSQKLGSSMRNAGVSAFVFFSARASNNVKNIAAFSADIFCRKNSAYIYNQQNWQCIANKQTVEFVRADFVGDKKYKFGS